MSRMDRYTRWHEQQDKEWEDDRRRSAEERFGEMEPMKLHDDSLMTFGKYRGRRLGEVPDSYLRWFLQQDWCDEYPDLVQYARNIEDDD